MSPDLEKRIVARWPRWFDIHGDWRRTAMPRGFECGDGWFDLIWGLCERLEPLVEELNAKLPQGDRFEVLQVKEKFGGLRFYVSRHTDAIDTEIGRARLESLRTCEECGQPGSHREGEGILATLCDR